jgi:hypothetical protein
MESARPDAREAAERASSARRRICHRRLALEAPRAGADDCGGAGGGEGEGEEDPMGRVPEMSASVTLRTGRGRWPYCSGWTEPHVHGTLRSNQLRTGVQCVCTCTAGQFYDQISMPQTKIMIMPRRDIFLFLIGDPNSLNMQACHLNGPTMSHN